MKSEGIIKDSFEAVLKELQTVISVFYILMVGIGMLFEYQRYILFGINIFDYADVFDFLIAPFKSPSIFLFIFLSLLIVYVIFRFDSFMMRKWPKFYRVSNFGLSERSWYPIFRYSAFLVLFVTYIFLASQILADRYKSGFIQEMQDVKISYADNSNVRGKIIGKTSETIFLLANGKVKIIPINSLVKEIDLSNEPFPLK